MIYKHIKKYISVVVLLAFMIPVPSAFARSDYGVFLSLDDEDMSLLKGYDIVVIDATYFTSDDIAALHKAGSTVYSYLNVGSLETFRKYYAVYKSLRLGKYENWDGEYWIDVSSERWQSFITGTLAPKLIAMGVDGFFIDNCDVYYHYPNSGIYDGLCSILKKLVSTGKKVIINGGDTFVDAYYEKNGEVKSILTGINQETVFTSIDFDNNKLKASNKTDRNYYKSYVAKYAKLGSDIYILEYTRNKTLKRRIRAWCKKMGYCYYISDSIELDG